MNKLIDKLTAALRIMKDRRHDTAGLGAPIVIIDDVIKDLQKLEQKGVNGSNPPLDWTILRQKYFSDCTVKDSVNGQKLRIDYAPHDLFEWFKREIQGYR